MYGIRRAKARLCSAVFAVIILTSTLTPAYAEDSQETTLKSDQTNKQMQNLDIDQIIKIETIRKSYQGLITAYKQKVMAEERIFNQKLGINTKEKDIREAFTPLAHAMEDVAVCQIKMMQEINQILNAQKQLEVKEQEEKISMGIPEKTTTLSLSSE